MSVEILKALARLDTETLDAAAKAARRAGVPLADYLSQAVVKKDEDAADETAASPEPKKPRTRKSRSRSTKAAGRTKDTAAVETETGDEGEAAEASSGVDLTPLTTAIEDLTGRLDRSEERSTRALSGMTDMLAAMAARLPQGDTGAGIERSAAFAELSQRVDTVVARLNQTDHARGADLDALQGLEQSIRRLTAHIERRQGATAETVGALETSMERLTSQFATLQQGSSNSAAAEELAERVFEIAEGLDAVRAKTENVVKRGQLESLEERIEVSVGKTLETALDRVLNEFTLRLEAAEGRSADAIQAVEGQIQGVEGQLAGTQQTLASLEERLSELQIQPDTSSAALAAGGALAAIEDRLGRLEQQNTGQLDDLRREFRDLSNRLTDLERVVTEQTAQTAAIAETQAAMAHAPAPAFAQTAPPGPIDGSIDVRADDMADPYAQQTPGQEAAGGYAMAEETPLSHGAYDNGGAPQDVAYEDPASRPYQDAAYQDAAYQDAAYQDPAHETGSYGEPGGPDGYGTQQAVPSGFHPAPASQAPAAYDTGFDDRHDADETLEQVPPRAQGLGGGSWRFAESDEFQEIGPEQRSARHPGRIGADPFGTERYGNYAQRDGNRLNLPIPANRAVVMAMSAAVAGAVLVGAFLALQPSGPSEPEMGEAAVPPADDDVLLGEVSGGSEIRALPDTYAQTGPDAFADPQADQSRTLSLDRAFEPAPAGQAPAQRSPVPQQPVPQQPGPSVFDTPSPASGGLSDLFESGQPGGVSSGSGQSFDIPSVSDVLSAPPTRPTAPAGTYGPMPAAASDARSLYADALDLLRNRSGEANDRRAAELLNQAANQGLAVAHYRLGLLFQQGRGVPADLTRAVSYYETAARAGNRRAMHNLAVMYASGQGVDADMTQAAHWFQRAAELGVTDSQFNLAVLYLRGDGVEISKPNALRWFAISAAQGDDGAFEYRDELAGDLGPQSERILSAASRWSPAPMDPEANGLFYTQPSRQDILRVQTLLNELGFEAGTPDGMIGPNTRNAIRAFEQANGLPVTGDVSPQLMSWLAQASAG